MAKKEKVLIDLIERWFEDRGTLSKGDYEMIKNMYWLVADR